jgi:hypothetical protein
VFWWKENGANILFLLTTALCFVTGWWLTFLDQIDVTPKQTWKDKNYINKCSATYGNTFINIAMFKLILTHCILNSTYSTSNVRRRRKLNTTLPAFHSQEESTKLSVRIKQYYCLYRTRLHAVIACRCNKV